MWCFCFLILIACTPPAERAEPPRESAPDPGSAPAPAPATAPESAPPSVERNITIEDVDVTNPLIVRGRARTFENNVVLRVRDAKGKLIRESFTTAEGEMGNHNPYRGTLWVTRDPGEQVTVEALEYSAKDGSEQFLFRVDKPFDVESIEATLYFPTRTAPA